MKKKDASNCTSCAVISPAVVNVCLICGKNKAKQKKINKINANK